MKRLIFILIPLLVSAVSLSAQTIEISGTVVDSDGETVIGAAVLVAGGGSNGTIAVKILDAACCDIILRESCYELCLNAIVSK